MTTKGMPPKSNAAASEYYNQLCIVRTSLCFNAAVLPIHMFKHRQPKDHISTAVVYSVSYGPDKVMCIET